MNEKIKIVILAAGLGKRMGNGMPKGLISVRGKPMLAYLAETVKEATAQRAVAVVGHKKEEIKKVLGDSLEYVEQEEQLGTGHALLCARDALFDAKRIVVLYADHPLVSKETIKKLLEKSKESNAEITLASAVVPNFENENKVFLHFGRIIRENGMIKKIREYKDANEAERNIKEINPGYYVFRVDWLWPNLERIDNDNSQGEYYMTDLIHLAQDKKIESIEIEPREALGANSKEELEILEKLMVQ